MTYAPISVVSGVYPSITPTNLTSPKDRFLGRREELCTLWSWFESDTAAISLVGAPGSGKTRLSQEFARDLLDKELDLVSGVWLIDFTTLDDGHSLLGEVGQILEISPPVGEAFEDAARMVASAAEEQGNLVFILDNAESLIEAASTFVKVWSKRLPMTRFLITSRVRIPLDQCALLEVGPLALPSSADLVDVEQSPSAQLLLSRLARIRPDFVLTEENSRLVEQLVDLLEGLPLALEAAAGILGTLGLQEVIDRAGDQIELLGSTSGAGQTTVTLQAAIATSWSSLSEWEREGLSQATVFTGNFDLDGAMSVIELSPGAPHLLEVLRSLYSKSLITFSSTAAADGFRFAMYAAIREFTAAQLDDGAAGMTRRRLLDHLVRRFKGSADPQALRSDFDSVVPLVDWVRSTATAGTTDSTPLLQKALELTLAVLEVGLHRSPRQFLDTIGAIVSAGSELDPALRADALRRIVRLSILVEPKPLTNIRLKALEALAAQYPEDNVLTPYRNAHIAVRISQHAIDEALEMCRVVMADAESSGNWSRLRQAHTLTAFAYTNSGQLRNARRSFEQALEIAEERFPGWVPRLLSHLALVENWAGRPVTGQKHAEKALQLFAQAGQSVKEGYPRRMLAAALAERGELRAARTQANLALREHRRLGFAIPAKHALVLLGELVLDLDDEETSDHYFREALSIGQPDPWAHLELQTFASRRAWLKGDLGEARRATELALELSDEIGYPAARAHMLARLGAIEASLGDLVRAQLLFDEADEIPRIGAPVAHWEVIDLYRGILSLARQRRGEVERAVGELVAQVIAPVWARGEGEGELSMPWYSRAALVRRVLVHLLSNLNSNEYFTVLSRALDPRGRHLVVSSDAVRFRLPKEPILDLAGKTKLRLLLKALVDGRFSGSDGSVSSELLQAQVWPGERILPDAARARVYMAVTSLRKAGLREHLENAGDSYRLAHSMPVLRLPSPSAIYAARLDRR